MPRAVDAAQRRDVLCDAVIALIRRGGLSAVTIRAVAAEIGGSTSAVTHYVGSRNELLALAVEREAAAWRAEISAASSGLHGGDRVRAIVSAAVVGGSDEQRLAWLAITLAAVQDEVVARSVQSFNDWWDAELAEAVTESGLDGLRSGWAQTVIDVIVAGMIVNAFESPGQWSRATTQEAVVRLIDLALESDGRPQCLDLVGRYPVPGRTNPVS